MAETLTITVDDGDTYEVSVEGVDLFTDDGLSTPVTFPQSVSADVTWYAAAPARVGGRRPIAVRVTSQDDRIIPVHSARSLPATVYLPEGQLAYVGPSSGGSSAVDYATFSFGGLQTVTSGSWQALPLYIDPAASNDDTAVTTDPDGATSVLAPVDGIYALTADAFPASDPAAASNFNLAAEIDATGSGCTVTNSIPLDTGMALSPPPVNGVGNVFFCPAGGVIRVRARQDTGDDLSVGGNASIVLLASATPPTPVP